MAVQLKIPYETVLNLVEQLPQEQKHELLKRLQEHTRKRDLTADEKIKLLRSIQFDVKIKEEPSIRREDWYDDDGR